MNDSKHILCYINLHKSANKLRSTISFVAPTTSSFRSSASGVIPTISVFTYTSDSYTKDSLPVPGLIVGNSEYNVSESS